MTFGMLNLQYVAHYNGCTNYFYTVTYTLHTATVLQNTEKSPGLASVKMGSAVRLPCSCEVRSELFLHRKCCHLPSVRACGAQRLVRVRASLCTLTSSAQKMQHIDTTGSVVESVYLVFR